jgi:hypothetical protein
MHKHVEDNDIPIILSAHIVHLTIVSDNFNGPVPYEQTFDLDKSKQKFHHSLKEHHKIGNIPKFRCEML